jgi:hypothetical protein
MGLGSNGSFVTSTAKSLKRTSTILRMSNISDRLNMIIMTYKTLVFCIKIIRRLPPPFINQTIFLRYINRNNTSFKCLLKLHIYFCLIITGSCYTLSWDLLTKSLDLRDYYSCRKLVSRIKEWYGCHYRPCLKNTFILLLGLLYNVISCSVSLYWDYTCTCNNL